MENDRRIIMILRPTGLWGIVKAELKQADSTGGSFTALRSFMSCRVGDVDERLRQLARTCEETEPQSLYVRHANRKMFRQEKDFWASEDTTVRRHVKRMADRGRRRPSSWPTSWTYRHSMPTRTPPRSTLTSGCGC